MNKIECTETCIRLLFNIPLFRDLPLNVQSGLLDRLDYTIYSIQRKDIIAKQNTPCKHLYVLLKGKLRVDIIDALGNEVMIEYIVAPRAYATPHLFSTDNTLPATFTALEDGILFTATKESLFKLIAEEPDILKNFLCITGNCNKCTVTRLRALSHKNVRNRLVQYLFENLKTESGVVFMEHNQVQLAEYLCVTRPALSKEINKLQKEKLIRIDGNEVHLLDPALLKKYIE
ncbi:Crp/Fnr family transcriptional regulator [Bacteroides sp. 224]|uniref:Crp/Fnr family transcriptional regulator n=1 Tax=Bacteroides sp. 224 TaxID=2302936 RepID=UPI0013CF97D8|nr:Crp/Fnr family transcriptional regulator [Bacteroides sp. 224]NDV65787.1 Crp/Fnr family transcriptional regulator [Bacteroides sp. 224]